MSAVCAACSSVTAELTEGHLHGPQHYQGPRVHWGKQTLRLSLRGGNAFSPGSLSQESKDKPRRLGAWPPSCPELGHDWWVPGTRWGHADRTAVPTCGSALRFVSLKFLLHLHPDKDVRAGDGLGFLTGRMREYRECVDGPRPWSHLDWPTVTFPGPQPRGAESRGSWGEPALFSETRAGVRSPADRVAVWQ
uniref:Uncharacterized protein n=1 Tax=Rangifer tarandus platyrhynchus TaxID=3082113 RepID=A0ACB0F6H4_RANTA|nr:unnamed protein product [Rangifer tarandus platyrhynchus]